MSETNSNEFLKGQRDCKAGVITTGNETESYLRGYATQYELEQVQGYITDEHSRLIKTING